MRFQRGGFVTKLASFVKGQSYKTSNFLTFGTLHVTLHLFMKIEKKNLEGLEYAILKDITKLERIL